MTTERRSAVVLVVSLLLVSLSPVIGSAAADDAIHLSVDVQHVVLSPGAAANVMLTADGQHVKLIDFGQGFVATATRSGAQTKVGADLYSSPEKLMYKRYDTADDIWAYGCMLAVLLLGSAEMPKVPPAESTSCVVG